jgi:hypothetical protein
MPFWRLYLIYSKAEPPKQHFQAKPGKETLIELLYCPSFQMGRYPQVLQQSQLLEHLSTLAGAE